MCGIIGYIGNKEAKPILLEGLKRLEYRGYDSAGVVALNRNRISAYKCKGKISDLEGLLKRKNLSGSVGLGHTRWATHGRPSRANAHPHIDCLKRIVVVHNGIIENFSDLKKELESKGCRFSSQTDTEVVAHLISRYYKGGLEEAVRRAVRRIKGSYALGIISAQEPDRIVAARCDSPLIVGIGKQENFIASDTSAILNHTRKVIYIGDGEVASVTRDSVKVSDLKGTTLSKKVDTVSFGIEEAQRGGFKHFMLKEISEQPKVLSRIVSQYLGPSDKINFPNLNLKRD